MNKNKIRTQFIDCLENKLSEEQKEKFFSALKANPELKDEFNRYRAVVEIGEGIAAKDFVAPSYLAVHIMKQVEEIEKTNKKSLFNKLAELNRIKHFGSLLAGVATCATVIFAVIVTTRHGDEILTSTNNPITKSTNTSNQIEDNKQNTTNNSVQVAVGNTIEENKAEDTDKILGEKSLPSSPNDGMIIQDSRVAYEAKKEAHLGEPIIERLNRAQETTSKEKEPMIIVGDAQITKDNKDSLVKVPNHLPDEKIKRDSGSPHKPLTDSFSQYVDSSYVFSANNGHFLNAETYADWTENLRTLVKTQPQSTFGLDVDTASYTNARRYIQSGQLPPPSSVRIEEFLNYFDYQFEGKEQTPFLVNYEIAPSPLETGRHILRIGVKTIDDSPEDKNAPCNLVFLIDVSGSMSDSNKLPLLKTSLMALATAMKPQDKIAIVTYSDTAQVILPSVNGIDKTTILSAINRLTAHGNTNGADGIDKAYKIAELNKIPNGVNRVILASDGDFNVGNYSFEGLMRLIEQKRKSGVTLTTLGFGTGNINDKNMEQLANKGNGNYFYIDSFEEAQKVLIENATKTMHVAAKDVKLQIEFNPTQVLEYRLVGYDNRAMDNRDFHDDTKDSGDVGYGQKVTALYEIMLADSPYAKQYNNDLRYQQAATLDKEKQMQQETSSDNNNKNYNNELAFLKIRFKDPNAITSKLIEYQITKNAVQSDINSASNDFCFITAVAEFASLLKQSQYAHPDALQNIVELAINSTKDTNDSNRAEFIKLLKSAQTLLTLKANTYEQNTIDR